MEKNKQILIQLLDEYVTTLHPSRQLLYNVKKSSILHNYIVKFSPDTKNLMEFCDLLYGVKEENINQIKERL